MAGDGDGGIRNRYTVEGKGMPAHVIKIKVFVDAGFHCVQNRSGWHACHGWHVADTRLQ